MFNLLQSASDDTTAIGACILTLVVSSVFVFASFHLGPNGQKLRNRSRKHSQMTDGLQTSFESDQSRERAA